MTVSPTIVTNRTTIRPVPKPKRRRARPIVNGRVAYRVAEAQGHAFEDIAADLEARQALDVAKIVDARRDPLIAEMVRLFVAIRHDVNTSAATRALATRGEACGREAIRLDQIVDEHHTRAGQNVDASFGAGKAVVTVHEGLLASVEIEPVEAAV